MKFFILVESIIIIININGFKKLEKDGTSEDICKTAEENVQKLTDAYIKKIDDHLAIKEAEIMKV